MEKIIIIQWGLSIFSFFILLLFILGIITHFHKSKKWYQEEQWFFLPFNLKVPFIMSILLMINYYSSRNLPELFNNGDFLFHIFYNSFVLEMLLVIIGSFIFTFFLEISFIKKNEYLYNQLRFNFALILCNTFYSLEYKNYNFKDKYGLKNIDLNLLKSFYNDIENNKLDISNYKKNIFSKNNILSFHFLEKNSNLMTKNISSIFYYAMQDFENKNEISFILNIIECTRELEILLRNPIKLLWKFI